MLGLSSPLGHLYCTLLNGRMLLHQLPSSAVHDACAAPSHGLASAYTGDACAGKGLQRRQL